MRFATSGSQPASLDAHGNTKRQRSCSHYTAICNQRVKKRIELRTREQQLIAEHKGGTNRAWFDPSRTRRTHEVPFIAGRSHFTRKNTRFPAPAFPQNEAHVTSMAAITVRFATSSSQPRISRRTWQHKTTTIMQPLHCDLQPESQETHRTTHTWTTTHCRTQRRNQSRLVRPQPHPPHTRGTFHRRPEPLYTEKHKVSCPGFPQNKAHVTSMQPWQCGFATLH